MRRLTLPTTLLFALFVLFSGCNEQTPFEPDQQRGEAVQLDNEGLTPSAKSSGSITENVTGTVEGGGTFEGILTITDFVVEAEQLYAQGTLSGTLTDASGDVIDDVTRAVKLPVNDVSTQQECGVLFLNIGPITLELLGLNVEVSEITIEITADPAEGILGDLLCAITDNINTNLQRVVDLLNQLLDLLG